MVERERILKLASRHPGSAAVLITLVRAEGSSYRKVGARLLTVDGEYAGTISGGCLEAEVVKKAAWTVKAGATVERYTTTFEDSSDIPYGLGCGGTVDLLFEPSETPECAALLKAFANASNGVPATIITALPHRGTPMRRAVLSDKQPVFRSPGLSEFEIAAALAGQLENALVEQLSPPQRLIVFGAGDDVRPLVAMAALLGWHSTVVDGRQQLARAERFPDAARVLTLQPGSVAEIGIRAEDAVVVMTHSYEQDRDWIAAVLPFNPRYLGLLGARHRSGLLVSEASAATGFSISECCARIYAPVGLDLGGEGPEAIALAVMAEAQACCMGRPAWSRRLPPTDVQAQITPGSASQYLPAHCALGASEV